MERMKKMDKTDKGYQIISEMMEGLTKAAADRINALVSEIAKLKEEVKWLKFQAECRDEQDAQALLDRDDQIALMSQLAGRRRRIIDKIFEAWDEHYKFPTEENWNRLEETIAISRSASSAVGTDESINKDKFSAGDEENQTTTLETVGKVE